ncbi:MAG: helix-turn-helix domain-containing protein [Clostridia bacterium]|nr:helix-turn-helix domain-containing protein [Clostridia bacterium]
MDNPIIRTYHTHVGNEQIRMMHIRPRDDDMHRHIFFELVYIVNGTATHHLGEEKTKLNAGDFFIIDTGSAHCYRDTKDFEIVNCLFLPEYVDRALSSCTSLSSLLSNQVLRFGVPMDICAADRIFHDDDGTIGKIIKNMEDEFNEKQTGYIELLRCHLTQILVYAVRTSEEDEQSRTFHPATKSIVSYLKEHFAEPLSLENLSLSLNYTPQYLSNLFRKDTGMTIQLFLQRLRVEKACNLLDNQDLRLAEVARMVGYNDVKHFSMVFKAHKGVTPKEFRTN